MLLVGHCSSATYRRKRFRKKSIQLTGPEALVLDLIAQAGRDGVTRDGLQKSLSRMRNSACMRAGKNFDTIIKRLPNARRRDNTTAPLRRNRIFSVRGLVKTRGVTPVTLSVPPAPRRASCLLSKPGVSSVRAAR